MIVIAGPPGVNVAPGTENSVGFAVKVEPPTVKMDGRGSVASVVVVSPTVNTPNESRLTVVPATTAAGPPAVIVVPDATRSAPSAVKDSPPTVNTDGVESLGSVVVASPTINTPDESRLTLVPATTAAGPSAVIVEPDPMRSAPSAVNR